MTSSESGVDLLLKVESTYIVRLAMCLFFVSVSVIQLVLRETRIKRLAWFMPKSSIFILIGIVIGGLTRLAVEEDVISQEFTSATLFDYLLPPIILVHELDHVKNHP
jgi:uncharacterized membrane protein